MSAADQPRSLSRRRLLFGLAAGGFGLAAPAAAQTPAPKGEPMPLPAGVGATAVDDYASRPVAYINGYVPVTRQDLGEFLIARGGAEKVDLLVNKKIIEAACAEAGVTVTVQEMEAALLDDLAGLSIKKMEFVQAVLPRYGKTYYEWMEDVIRPRLLLTKLCRERVTVTDEEVRQQFDREFGEQRRVQIVGWPASDSLKAIQEMHAKIYKDPVEFDRAAAAQGNPALAAAKGYVKPIGRHAPGTDSALIEKEVFAMKPGDVSGILKTSQGYLMIKLHEVIPPRADVKFDDHKDRLRKLAFEERMSQEIPKYFAELRQKANPKVVFDGPTEWRFKPATQQTAQDVLKGAITGGAPVVPAGGKQ